jgi:hypothetical protein
LPAVVAAGALATLALPVVPVAAQAVCLKVLRHFHQGRLRCLSVRAGSDQQRTAQRAATVSCRPSTRLRLRSVVVVVVLVRLLGVRVVLAVQAVVGRSKAVLVVLAQRGRATPEETERRAQVTVRAVAVALSKQARTA